MHKVNEFRTKEIFLSEENFPEWKPALTPWPRHRRLNAMRWTCFLFQQDFSLECGICYAYRLDNAIPESACDDPRCGQPFHTSCLYEVSLSCYKKKMMTKTSFLKRFHAALKPVLGKIRLFSSSSDSVSPTNYCKNILS